LTAKLTAVQNEFERILSEKDRAAQVQTVSIVRLCAQTVTEPISDPISGVQLLSAKCRELEQHNVDCVAVRDELSQVQALLGVPDQNLIVPVQRTLRELQDVKGDNANLQEAIRSLRGEKAKLTKDFKVTEARVANTGEWEKWARRLHGIVHNAQSGALSMKELRASLEEAAIGSVSQRLLLFRLSILRDEKKALLKYSKSLLVEKSFIPATWHPLLSVFISIRRMQHAAHCVPLALAEPARPPRR
jgi:hypothetical protein